jgi:hypothetical protein
MVVVIVVGYSLTLRMEGSGRLKGIQRPMGISASFARRVMGIFMIFTVLIELKAP